MPLMLVSGVLAPFTEPAGVELDGETSPAPSPPLAMPAFFFAAFSARRFCLEADGGMMVVEMKTRSMVKFTTKNFDKIGRTYKSSVTFDVQEWKSCFSPSLHTAGAFAL